MKIKELFEDFKPDIYRIQRPYIIAEAGVNHECKMDIARRLIEEAAEGGADAIKFQTYKAETIAAKDSPSYWDRSKEPTDSQYKLFKKYDKFWKNEFEQLKNYCDDCNIEFLSTPFDVESADFLNDLMDVYKISSSDLNNKPFIEYICGFGKPVILSTGASYLDEIREAVDWIDAKGNPVALLHCILNYPTDNSNANLAMIKDLQHKFPDKMIGYSDHTLPADMEALTIAALLGAELLEKHFTHDKSLPGNDHYHAMDMHDLKVFNKKLDAIFELLGSHQKTSLESEEISRKNARRSLVATREIPEGKIIEAADLTWKRPAYGISPRHINEIIGKKATRSIYEDEVIQREMFI